MRSQVRWGIGGIVLGLAIASGGPSYWPSHAAARTGIRHKFVSAKPDGGDPAQVQPSNWNDEHTFDVLGFGTMSAPLAPIDGDCWTEATGSSPARILAWKCRDGGVTRTLASITF